MLKWWNSDVMGGDTSKGRRKGRPAHRSPQHAPSEYVFSTSIDLVGSTDAKTRVMNLAREDVVKIDKLNALIYREFCRIERKFYESALAPIERRLMRLTHPRFSP